MIFTPKLQAEGVITRLKLGLSLSRNVRERNSVSKLSCKSNVVRCCVYPTSEVALLQEVV